MLQNYIIFFSSKLTNQCTKFSNCITVAVVFLVTLKNVLQLSGLMEVEKEDKNIKHTFLLTH